MMNPNRWPSHYLQKNGKILIGQDVGFSFGTFETTHVHTSGKLAPNIMFSTGKPPTQKDIPHSDLDSYPKYLCFKINDENGKTLGQLPLDNCSYTILYDPVEHESTPHWKTVSSPLLMYLYGGAIKFVIIPGNGKLMFSYSMVLHWESTKNLVNGGNLIQVSFSLEIFQTSTKILLILDQLTCYSRSIEI